MIKVDFKFNINPIQRKPVELKNLTGEKICFTGKVNQDTFELNSTDGLSPKQKVLKSLKPLITANPRLPKTQELALIKQYRELRDSGNPNDKEKAYQLRDRIANSHLKLIIHYANKYEMKFNHLGINFEDLVQEGFIGSYRYIDKGKISKKETKPNFSIFSEMLKHINLRVNSISLSKHAIEKIIKAKSNADKLAKEENVENNPSKEDEKFKMIEESSKNVVRIDDPDVYRKIGTFEEPSFPELTEELINFLSKLYPNQKDMLLTKAGVEEKDGMFVEIINPQDKLKDYDKIIAEKHGIKANSIRQPRSMMEKKLPTIKGYRELAKKAGLPGEMNRNILINELDKLAKSGKTQIAEAYIYSSPDLSPIEKDCIVSKYLKRKTVPEMQVNLGCINPILVADRALMKIGYVEMLDNLRAEKAEL